MPRPVRDLLLDLEEDVHQVRLAPARAVRERGRTRTRRRVALTATGLTVVAGLAGMGLLRSAADSSLPPAAPQPTASSDRCAQADVRLPVRLDQVEVRVIDVDADRDEAVATDLRNRGFTTTAGGSEPAGTTRAEAVATLRYGPRAVGKAAVLQAMLLNKADTQFDPARADVVVDLVVGRDFRQLATPTEVNQALAEAGEPTLPPGCR